MASPFPGMDPYLEDYWGDVHHRLVTYACDQLQAQMPAELRARMEERVFVQAEEGIAGRSIYPDVHVVERGQRAAGHSAAASPAAAEPLVIEIPSEEVTEGFIEIVELGTGRRIVTVIEFLSPANKFPGEGQRLYLQKQREVLQGKASLVEIDLLRAGPRVLSVPEARFPPSHRTPYRICVRRAWRPHAAELYPARLSERLPAIRIPLREKDPDAVLDLQTLIELSYRNGAYGADIDYAKAPRTPLEKEDAVWADGVLREKGLRI